MNLTGLTVKLNCIQIGKKTSKSSSALELCEAFLFFKFCIHSNSVHPCVVKVTSFGLYFGFPSRFGLSKCGVNVWQELMSVFIRNAFINTGFA